jgi:hypothetical protein
MLLSTSDLSLSLFLSVSAHPDRLYRAEEITQQKQQEEEVVRRGSSSLRLRGQSGSIAMLEMTCFSTIGEKKMQFYECVLAYWATVAKRKARMSTVSSDNNSSSSSI